MPKVSVIMGVYNTPKNYIDIAIESILNQTYTDFEFILCNDGCSDDTFKYVYEKYKNNKKIVWLENEGNRGLTYTLNHCLSVAKGEYIARMDSDDFSHLDRFEKQVNILDNNEDIGLVNCNINVFNENGIFGERKYNEYIEKKDFLKSNPIVHPAVMGRKSSFEKVGNYRDIEMTVRNEDYDLFMRMYASGIKMYTIQEKIFDFRENEATVARRKFKYRINEYKVKKENFKKLGLLPKYYLYCLKPIFVAFIPNCILKKLRNK